MFCITLILRTSNTFKGNRSISGELFGVLNKLIGYCYGLLLYRKLDRDDLVSY